MAGADATRDRVAAALLSPLSGLGLDLEAVELTPAGRRRILRVAVDKDGGVTHDDLADADRAVSAVLDGPEGAELLGEQPYTLEVTSRGVDRPLTLPRHWRRNVHRLVAVQLHDGAELSGRVESADEDEVTLSVDGRPRGIRLADVSRALVQIEFNRPTAKEA